MSKLCQCLVMIKVVCTLSSPFIWKLLRTMKVYWVMFDINKKDGRIMTYLLNVTLISQYWLLNLFCLWHYMKLW